MPMTMYTGRTTLSKFLIEHLADQGDQGQLAALLVDVAAAVKSIAVICGKGALGGVYGAAGSVNAQGEEQKRLDVLADEVFIEHCNWGGQLAAMASEERADVVAVKGERGRYLLTFDPLDGSSNIEMNVSVGTIFSVLDYAQEKSPEEGDFLQPGHRQVAAGYAIYGPATMLILTAGKGTHGFTLEREIGNFVLTHPDLRIAEDTHEFAINVSNERFWEPPIQRYVAECKDGQTGIRQKDFNMRWIASMVADVHRIMMRGGVFMYPRDSRADATQGRLRQLYEASPMAFLVEQAGGAASTGRERILDVRPGELHQRIPVILGSRSEVERIQQYHQDYDSGDDQPYRSPLFNDRSLYSEEL